MAHIQSNSEQLFEASDVGAMIFRPGWYLPLDFRGCSHSFNIMTAVFKMWYSNVRIVRYHVISVADRG